MNRQQLIHQIFTKKTFLCVGLDTDISKIPEHLKNETDPIFAFNKAIIIAWPISPTSLSMKAMD